MIYWLKTLFCNHDLEFFDRRKVCKGEDYSHDQLVYSCTKCKKIIKKKV